MQSSNEPDKKTNKIKPVCDIVEYANKRFTLFWYIAEIAPTVIELKQQNKNKYSKVENNSKKLNKKSFTKILKSINFGAEAKSIVTFKIEPS